MRARPTATDDRRVRWLPLLAGFAALGQHAGRTARMTAASCTAFAAAHRMRHRVHGRAAIVRFAALVAIAAGLAEANVHVVRVTDAADRRPALARNTAHFARGHRHL